MSIDKTKIVDAYRDYVGALHHVGYIGDETRDQLLNDIDGLPALPLLELDEALNLRLGDNVGRVEAADILQIDGVSYEAADNVLAMAERFFSLLADAEGEIAEFAKAGRRLTQDLLCKPPTLD